MAEIERKFLVGQTPSDLPPGRLLRQGYLALDGEVEVRIRDDGERCVLTVKGGRGLERVEVEVDLDPAAAAELWPLAQGRLIEKRRHRLALGPPPGGAASEALVAEIDCYQGRLEGLTVVEVELADRAAAEAFRPPSWFGRELTGRPGWSNAELAQHGRPPV